MKELHLVTLSPDVIPKSVLRLLSVINHNPLRRGALKSALVESTTGFFKSQAMTSLLRKCVPFDTRWRFSFCPTVRTPGALPAPSRGDICQGKRAGQGCFHGDSTWTHQSHASTTPGKGTLS